MRTLLLSLLLLTSFFSFSQERCASAEYLSVQQAANPDEAIQLANAESFLQKQAASFAAARVTFGEETIRIPVVVHILYNNAAQNLSDAQVQSQIEALNRDFRRRNADTLNTPLRFRSLAADIGIEFYLATADPKGRATNGIVRKYSAIANWMNNDKIKSAATGGDDAWDSKGYLNIWVGHLVAGGGYSTAPGSDAAKDGIVITTEAFGTIGRSGNTSLGRVAVHEAGHWLGLKHIWGDAACGDDGISDTPPQKGYTLNCPSGFISTCSNSETGDMYMNYMDYTADACMNLFTIGQKRKMLAAFQTGGPRASFLQSKGLQTPWLEESVRVAGASAVVLYPNPASSELTINLSEEKIGQTLLLYNANGILVQSIVVKSAQQKISLTTLKTGVYFLKGQGFSERFIKL